MGRVVLALALAFAVRAAADEDDPKLDRPLVAAPPVAAPPSVATPGPEVHFADEDDPKLARGTVHKRAWAYHDVPRFKLAYRYMQMAGLEGGETTFHALELDYYPWSMRFFRFGLDTEVGFAGGPFSLFYFTVGPTVGFQWPARVTPFIDARFIAGLAGADVE